MIYIIITVKTKLNQNENISDKKRRGKIFTSLIRQFVK